MNSFNKIIPAVLTAIFFLATLSEATAEPDTPLTPRQKAIIPIAAFTAIGNMEKLGVALNAGMEAGLTVNEVKEILIHTYAYAGFPRALNGIEAYMAVLKKRQEQGISDVTGKEATPVPADFNSNAYGHQVRNALVGKDISKRSSGYPVFTPIIDQFLVEHLFADIFYRDVLSHQERELVTISILAAMAGTEAQLKSHLGISRNMGFSTSQLEDFVVTLRNYVDTESAERATKTLNDLLGISAPNSHIKPIKVTKKQQPTKGAADSFTGNVTVESRFTSQPPDHYQGGTVNFEAGARTAWHSHPWGQTLVILSGRGLVQSEGEKVQEILPGDVVWIPADARHWHGAAPDSPMAHVAISTPRNDSTVKWMEHVDAKQYGY